MSKRKKNAAPAAPQLELDPKNLAEYAADVVAEGLGYRAVPNHAFTTREAASSAGFTQFAACFEVSSTVSEMKQLAPAVQAAATGLLERVLDRPDFGRFLAFAPAAEGVVGKCGPVTVGCCTTRPVAGKHSVTLTALVLSNEGSMV